MAKRRDTPPPDPTPESIELLKSIPPQYLAERWGRTYAEFYTLVGRCVAEWANIEDWLFKCCNECIGPYEQAAIVYYKTPGVESRLTLLDELIRSVLPRTMPGSQPDERIKTWKKLFGDIKKLLSVRRRIAHQPISEIGNYLGYVAEVLAGDTPIFQIHASRHERTRAKEAEKKPLLKADLENHLKELDSLTLRAEQFYEILAMRHGELPPPSREPPP